MPQIRRVLGACTIEVAQRRRVCHRDRKHHSIEQCWRSTKVAFCDQRKSRSRGGVRPAWVTLAASAFGGVCGGGGEGLVLA